MKYNVGCLSEIRGRVRTMFGYIYKITNKTNGKVYIGKTTKTVQERWREHSNDTTKERCENRPLYKAIRKYGMDAFNVETIEEADLDVLSERETYWIGYFNTYYNGYNATTGGDGKVLYDYDLISQLLRDGRRYREIVDIVGCSLDTVAFVNKKYNIGYVQEQAWVKRCIPIEQYDLDGHYIQSFSSYGDAIRWLFENKYTSNAKDNIGTHISAVVKGNRKTAYGFIWKKK